MVPARFLAESGRLRDLEVGDERAESSVEEGELGTEPLEVAKGLFSAPAPDDGADPAPFVASGGTPIGGGVDKVLTSLFALTALGFANTASEIVLLSFTGEGVGLDRTASEMVDPSLEGLAIGRSPLASGAALPNFLAPGAEPIRVGVVLSVLELGDLIPEEAYPDGGIDLVLLTASEEINLRHSCTFS